MSLGLHFTSAKETLEKEAERKMSERVLQSDITEDVQPTSRLHQRIRNSWQRNRDGKVTVEKLMVKSLRDRKGEYDPEKLADIREAGASEIFVPVPTSKIRAAVAHIKQVLLPPGNQRAHGIDPTPLPELPEWVREEILNRIKENPQATDAAGNPIPVEEQADRLEHMTLSALLKRGTAAARKMERKINDQLDEAGFSKALSDFVDDFCTVECAFLKIEKKIKPKLVHSFDEDRIATIETVKKESFNIRTINPFDAYWAPGSDSPERGDFIERLRLSRGEVYDMIKLGPPYNEESIRRALNSHDSGSLTNWLWTDRVRSVIADNNSFWEKSTSDIDALNWYGTAPGKELIEWGVPESEIEDVDDEYHIEAIMIGYELVMVRINKDPLNRRGIFASSYEKVPGNIAGNSPARLMRDSTNMINSCARSLQNNLAYASGFQVEVDYTRISSETKIHDIHPYKIWQARESEYSGDRRAVNFFQPESNASELLAIIDRFKNQAAADTGIPDVMHGTASAGLGADATARGQAMLLDNAAQLLRFAVRNVDEDVVVPLIEYLYHYNMRFDPDPSIKGDLSVVARGTNAMLQRQDARQNIMAMLEILKDEYYRGIIGDEGAVELLNTLFDTFDEVDTQKIFPDTETVLRRLEAVRSQPPQPDPTQALKSESDLKIAEIRANADMQRATIEAQGYVASQQDKSNTDRILKTMELRNKSDLLDKELAGNKEIADLKVRASRLDTRERSEADLIKAKMIATNQAKLKIAELRARLAETKNNADEVQSTEEGEVEDTGVDIEAIVKEAVEANMGGFKDEVSSAIKQISESIRSDMDATATGGDINLNINMPECKPVKKKVTTSRDASGNLQADITPEKQ